VGHRDFRPAEPCAEDPVAHVFGARGIARNDRRDAGGFQPQKKEQSMGGSLLLT